MISAEGLSEVGKLEDQGAQKAQDFNRFQQAQLAAEDFKNGNVVSAYARMGSADPNFWEKIAPHVSAINPQIAETIAKAQKSGQIKALIEAQNDPATLQLLKNQGKAQSANDKQSIVKDADGNIYTADAQKNITGQIVNGKKVAIKSQPSQTTELIPGIAPAHQKIVNGAIDDLTKGPQFKDANTEINGLKQASDLASGNLPNSEQPLVMKFLTSSEFVKRFNQAEYAEGPTQAKAIIDKVRNAIQEKKTGQLDPKVMQDFQNIIDVLSHATLNEYEGQLHSSAGAVSSKTNGKVSSDSAFKTLLPAANPIVRQKLELYNKLPADQKQAVDWARQHLGDPRAKAIFDKVGF